VQGVIATLSTALVVGLSGCAGRPEAGNSNMAGTNASGAMSAGGAPDVASTDGADMDASASTCSSPQDCPNHFGPQLYCCVNHACAIDEPDACADGGEQPIVASNYDQSCTTDMDCVAIGEGNACSIIGPCSSAAINKGAAYSKYQSDIANTPCFGISGCPAELGPCCRHGVCQMNDGCSSPADTLPACADAGGTCMPFILSCRPSGPPDSCAYSDETCCLR
jgi:hypothetical protein